MPSSSTDRPGIASISLRVAAIPARVSPSSSSPWTQAMRRAASSEPERSALGLVVSTRLTQRSTIASSTSSPAPEVEHRRLREAADDLVGRGDDQVGALAERVGGQIGVEAQVGAPGLVDGQRHAVAVGDRGQPGYVGAGAEVGGRDDHRPDRPGGRRERLVQRVRRQAVGDAELGIELRRGEARPHTAEDEPVDHRGVDVALHDHGLAGVRESQADRVVPLRCAVDQEPGPPRLPGLGRQLLRPFERRRPRADVDAFGDRGDVVAQAQIADQLAQRRVGAHPALVPRDLETAWVAGRVGEQRVDVGGRLLAVSRHRIESTPGRPPLRRHFRGMKHTSHGYWLEEAGTVDAAPPLAGALEADVVVIGGGYTGMWTAWHLTELEPEARIVLLEGAERCGQGPSGRNGGFCNAMWLALPNMRERWGAEGALAVARAAVDAVDGIEDFCAAEGVDAWFRRAGFLKVSTAAAHDGTSAEAVAACRELGEADAVEELSGEEVAARCASPLFRGGVLFPDAATVQPARLALGLRERLLARGVEIRESSAAAEPEEASRPRRGPHRGRPGEGGEGGAGDRRRGEGNPRPAARQALDRLLAHRPHRAGAGAARGDRLDRRRVHHRQPRSGRLLSHHPRRADRLRLGRGADRPRRPARRAAPSSTRRSSAQTVEHLGALFPGLEGTTVTHAWGGPIDASPTHLPLVLPLRGGRAFAAAGYTGNGVGPSHMVARTLASLALDRHDEASRLAFVDPSPPWVPPEPLHWIGGEAIRAGIQAKEEAELAGREPGLVSSTLARVPELIGFHIGR